MTFCASTTTVDEEVEKSPDDNVLAHLFFQIMTALTVTFGPSHQELSTQVQQHEFPKFSMDLNNIVASIKSQSLSMGDKEELVKRSKDDKHIFSFEEVGAGLVWTTTSTYRYEQGAAFPQGILPYEFDYLAPDTADYKAFLTRIFSIEDGNKIMLHGRDVRLGLELLMLGNFHNKCILTGITIFVVLDLLKFLKMQYVSWKSSVTAFIANNKVTDADAIENLSTRVSDGHEILMTMYRCSIVLGGLRFKNRHKFWGCTYQYFDAAQAKPAELQQIYWHRETLMDSFFPIWDQFASSEQKLSNLYAAHKEGSSRLPAAELTRNRLLAKRNALSFDSLSVDPKLMEANSIVWTLRKEVRATAEPLWNSLSNSDKVKIGQQMTASMSDSLLKEEHFHKARMRIHALPADLGHDPESELRSLYEQDELFRTKARSLSRAVKAIEDGPLEQAVEQYLGNLFASWTTTLHTIMGFSNDCARNAMGNEL